MKSKVSLKERTERLKTCFKVLSKLDGKKPFSVDKLLKENKVLNVNQTGTYIRRNFLQAVPGKKNHYRWNSNAKQPNLATFHLDVVNHYRNANTKDSVNAAKNILPTQQKVKKVAIAKTKTPKSVVVTKTNATTKKPFGYWKKDRCVAEAKTFKSRSEWQKKSGSSYFAARKNAWVDECTSHMGVIAAKTKSNAKTIWPNKVTQIKPIDGLESKIQMAVKRTILQHYMIDATELKRKAIADAKQYGVELTKEDINQLVVVASSVNK